MPIYTVKGKRYNIPDDVVADFEKDMPDATQRYKVGEDFYNVPVSRKQAFLKKYSDAMLFDETKHEEPVTEAVIPPTPEETYAVTGNGRDPESGLYTGGAGTKAEADSIFDVNARRIREKYANQNNDDTQGKAETKPYEYKPEVQEHIVSNIPGMFRNRTSSLMDKPLGDAAGLPELTDRKHDARENAEKRYLKSDEFKQRQKKEVANRVTELSSSVDSELKSIDQQIEDRQRAVRDTDWRPGMPSSRDDRTLAELRGQRSYLNGASELLEESQKIIDEAGKKDSPWYESLGRGVRDTAFDVDNWTSGVSDLIGNMRLNKVLEKADRIANKEEGVELTPAEEKLLDAAVTNMAVMGYYSSDLSRAYKAGQTTGESLPFMLEMIANPISASGNATAKILLKYGLKKAGAQLGKNIGKTIGAAAGMTATTGLPGVLAGGYDRMNGQINFGMGRDGKLTYEGRENAMGAVEAFGKSAASRFLENHSEMVFNAFNGLGDVFWKGVQKVVPGGVNNFIQKAANTKAGQLFREFKDNELMKEAAKRSQFHGIFGEYVEEVYNNLANIPLGEMTAQELTDLDNNIDTFLGLAPTSVVFGMIGLGGMAAERIEHRQKMNAAFGSMNESQRKMFAELERMSKENGNEDIRTFIKETIADPTLSKEQKRQEIEYAYDIAVNNAFDSVAEEQTAEQSENRSAAQAEGEQVFASGDPSAIRESVVREDVSRSRLEEVLPDVETLANLMNADDAGRAEILSSLEENVRERAKVFLRDYDRRQAVEDAIDDAHAPEVEAARNRVGEMTRYGKVTVVPLGKYGDATHTHGVVVNGLDESGSPSSEGLVMVVPLENGPTGMNFDSFDANNAKPVQIGPNMELSQINPDGIVESMLGAYQADVDALNPSPVMAGQQYQVMNEAGQPVTVQVQSVDLDGNVTAVVDGKSFVLPEEEFQAQIEGEKRLAIETEYATAENERSEAQKEAQKQVLASESKKVLPDGRLAVFTAMDGNEAIFDIVDSEGNIMDSDSMLASEFESLKDYAPTAESTAEQEEVPSTEVSSTQENTETDGSAAEDPLASLPRKKDGSLDYDSFTPQQAYEYTSQTESPEVALEDLKADIEESDRNLASLREQLSTASRGKRISLRDAIRSAESENKALKDYLDKVAPAAVAVTEEGSAQASQTDMDKEPLIEDTSSVESAQEEPQTVKLQDKTRKKPRPEKQEPFKAISEEMEASPVAQEILARTEPESLEELASVLLGNSIFLQMSGERSAREMTGFGHKDLTPFLRMFRGKDKGGMTVEAAGDRLLEIARESYPEIISREGLENDNTGMAGTNAILSLIGQSRTFSDISGYIRNNRISEAQSAMNAENEYNEQMEEEWYWENFHTDKAGLEALESGEAFSESYVHSPDEIVEYYNNFADEILKVQEYDRRNESLYREGIGQSQEDDSRGIQGIREGSDDVLQGTQSVLSEGEEGHSGESGQVYGQASADVHNQNDGVQGGTSGSESIVTGEAAEEEIQSYREKIHSWLSEENLESATEMTREETFEKFGNAPEPISYIPIKYLSIFGEDITDNHLYCGKGYFIDHAANHHPEVDVNEYDLLQDVLSNPDTIKEVGNSIAFTKMQDKGFAVLVQLSNERGKIVLHKSMFWRDKGMPYKNKKDVEVKPLVGGRSTISPNDNSIAGRLLSALNGTTNVGNYLVPQKDLDDFLSEIGEFEGKNNLSVENKENQEDVASQIEKARKDVDLNPTEAQKEAGNYKKGHIKIDGYDITIENPKGGVRSGTDKNGKEWSITMNNDYGYIRGTEAVDGDHIDVFLSDNPTEGNVFVVDQTNEDGSFDESKVMYGFPSMDEAREAYLSNYSDGWESRIMAITEVSKEEFKKWIDSSHRKTKAFSEYKSVKQYGPSIESSNASRMQDIENRLAEIEDRKIEISDLKARKGIGTMELAYLLIEEKNLGIEQLDLESEYSGLRAMNDESNAILEEEGSTLRFREVKEGREAVEKIASEYNVPLELFDYYESMMNLENLTGASQALIGIKNVIRKNIPSGKLSEFIPIYKNIRKEIFKSLGDLDELRSKIEAEAVEQANLMESARKRAEEDAAKERDKAEKLAALSESDLDSEYFKALEEKKEDLAKDLINEAARRKGYIITDYKDTHSAPASQVDRKDFTNKESLKNLQEDGFDVNVYAIANGISPQADDYFEKGKERVYMNEDKAGRESLDAIRSAISSVKEWDLSGKEGHIPQIKVYRAVPKSIKGSLESEGQWVTPSRTYAQTHGEARFGEGKYRIIEQDVPVTELWWDGNDVREWGYDDGRIYVYKNVKNNKKLFDVVTRDDKNNIIPPSKRFDSRKGDVRYRFIGERGAKKLDQAEEATTRLDNLAVAREMESAEKDAKAIKMATGWERGADGKWRYEVKDRFNVDAIERFVRGAYGKTFGAKVPLERVLKDDDTLLTEYPQLKETSVKFQRLGDSWGVYYPESNEIAINTNFIREEREISDRLERQKELVEQWKKPEESKKIMDMIKVLELNPEEVLKDAEEKLVGIEGELDFFKNQMRERLETTVIHEVQHAIQHIEGFEHGGNVDSAKKEMASLVKELGLPSNTTLGMLKQGFNEGYATFEQVEKANMVAEKRGFKDIESYLNSLNPERFYNNLSGEVEARNAARRSHAMNEDEMREYLASETEDVSREDQIFLQENAGGGASFSISNHGSDIQREIDKFTSKYDSKEVVMIDSQMTDEELEEAIPYSSAKRTREEISSGYPGGYSPNTDKIYIFVDNQELEDSENTMFHENLHPLFNNSAMVEEFYGNAKEDKISLIETLSEAYNESEIPNEMFAHMIARDMSRGDFRFANKYLSEESRNELFNTLNEFGYDRLKEEPVRRGQGNVQRDVQMDRKPQKAEQVDRGLHEGKESAERRGSDRKEGIIANVQEIASQLNTPVEIIGNVDAVPNAEARKRIQNGANIKGWYENGKVYLYLPNAVSVPDACATVWHEVIGHKGLRGLFGKDFNTMLDNVYANASAEIKSAIDSMAKEEGISVREATEEYMADLAERGPATKTEKSLWEKIKSFFLEMLGKANVNLGFELTDNDLRYILWESEKKLRSSGRTLDVAKETSMRNKLGVGEFSTMESGERFREEKPLNELDLLKMRISYLEKAINTYKDENQVKIELIEFINKELKSEVVNEITKQELMSLLVQVKNAKGRVGKKANLRALTKILLNVETVILNAQRRKHQRTLDKLLSLKVQDVNGKNMSIAKNVDDSTRKIFSYMKGRVADLKSSEYAEEILSLKRKNREFKAQIQRLERRNQELNDLLRQLERQVKTTGTQEKDKTEDQMKKLQKEINDNKTQIDNLQKKIEDNKVLIEELKQSKEDVEQAKLRKGDIDLDTEMKRLNDKLDDTAKGNAVWTQGDSERLAALNIMQSLLYIKGKDNEVLSIEREIGKLLQDNSSLYKSRPSSTESSREKINRKIGENRRQIAARTRLINDVRALQVQQLQETISQMNELIANGKNSLLKKVEDEAKRKSYLIGRALRSVEGKEVDIFDNKASHEGMVKKFFSAPLGSFEYMTKRVNTKTLGKDGFLYKYFIEGKNGVIEAENTYLRGMFEARGKLDEKSKEIFGKSFESVWKKSDKVIEKSGVFVYDTFHQDPNGYGVKYEKPLSKGQAMYIYMAWKMTDGRTKLEVQGFDEESIAEIVGFIGDDYVKMANWIQEELLSDLREKYNEKYLQMYNTSMANIPNYVPLRIRKESVRQESSLSEDKERKKTLEERAGSLINRVANTKPVDITLSAFDVVFDHINQMEEWNAYARVRRDLDAILSNTDFRNQLNANQRGSFENFYDAAAVATRSNRPDKAKYMDEVLGKFSKGVVGGNIAFRLNTALKQVLSAPAFFGYSQDPRFAGHLLKNVAKEIAWDYSYRWSMENLPSFRERVKSGTAGNEKLKDKAISKVLDKYIEIGMIPNKMIDALVCSVGAKSIFDFKYNRYKKAGMKEEEARRLALAEADIYYNATQQSSHPAFMSPVQMSRTFTDRMLTTYQNSNIGYVRRWLSAMYDIMRSFKWKELKKNYTEMYMEQGMSKNEAETKAVAHIFNENRKALVTIALFSYGLNWFWDLGSQGLLGALTNEPEEEKEPAEKFLNGLSYLVTTPIKGMPGGNLLVSLSEGYGMNPFLVYDEIESNVKEIQRAIDKYGVISPEIAYKALDLTTRIGGVDLEVWGNVYMGLEGAFRDGIGHEEDGIINLMLFLNSPKSQREAVAKNIYKNMSVLEYARSVQRAAKYVPKNDPWESWVPGTKEYSKRKESELKKEHKRRQAE